MSTLNLRRICVGNWYYEDISHQIKICVRCKKKKKSVTMWKSLHTYLTYKSFTYSMLQWFSWIPLANVVAEHGSSFCITPIPQWQKGHAEGLISHQHPVMIPWPQMTLGIFTDLSFLSSLTEKEMSMCQRKKWTESIVDLTSAPSTSFWILH